MTSSRFMIHHGVIERAFRAWGVRGFFILMTLSGLMLPGSLQAQVGSTRDYDAFRQLHSDSGREELAEVISKGREELSRIVNDAMREALNEIRTELKTAETFGIKPGMRFEINLGLGSSVSIDVEHLPDLLAWDNISPPKFPLKAKIESKTKGVGVTKTGSMEISYDPKASSTGGIKSVKLEYEADVLGKTDKVALEISGTAEEPTIKVEHGKGIGLTDKKTADLIQEIQSAWERDPSSKRPVFRGQDLQVAQIDWQAIEDDNRRRAEDHRIGEIYSRAAWKREEQRLREQEALEYRDFQEWLLALAMLSPSERAHLIAEAGLSVEQFAELEKGTASGWFVAQRKVGWRNELRGAQDGTQASDSWCVRSAWRWLFFRLSHRI